MWSEESVKAIVRIRPIFAREEAERIHWIAKDSATVERTGGYESYAFDRVFDSLSSTREVYDDCVENIIKASANGYNGTILAYGQTNSGKTHTIFGSDTEPGIVLMTVKSLFDAITSENAGSCHLRISFIELFNEKVRDLLVDDMKDHALVDVGDQTVIQGLTEKIIASENDAKHLIETASARRCVGETSMNMRSSRSHVIVRLTVENSDDVDRSYVSYVNIVDLAGSENSTCAGNQRERLHEGGNINKSLLALRRVIHQLGEKSEHISFRDSKLTRLLKSSFGGSTRTLIICNISPMAGAESSIALKFALRAKIIKIQPNCKSNTVVFSSNDLALESQRIEELKQLKEEKIRLTKEILRLRRCILTGAVDQFDQTRICLGSSFEMEISGLNDSLQINSRRFTAHQLPKLNERTDFKRNVEIQCNLIRSPVINQSSNEAHRCSAESSYLTDDVPESEVLCSQLEAGNCDNISLIEKLRNDVIFWKDECELLWTVNHYLEQQLQAEKENQCITMKLNENSHKKITRLETVIGDKCKDEVSCNLELKKCQVEKRGLEKRLNELNTDLSAKNEKINALQKELRRMRNIVGSNRYVKSPSGSFIPFNHLLPLDFYSAAKKNDLSSDSDI